jgi:hypothetical protein
VQTLLARRESAYPFWELLLWVSPLIWLLLSLTLIIVGAFMMQRKKQRWLTVRYIPQVHFRRTILNLGSADHPSSLRGQHHIRGLGAVEHDLGFDSAQDLSHGFDIETS